MAKLRKNAVISGLSGKFGKDHYARHTRDGKTIICENPDFSNRQFSEAQLNVQSGMKAAAAYAKVASRQNPIYAELARKKSKKKVKNAYNVAVGDWFHAPEIDRIEWHNGHIRVQASDDVLVTRVTVTILGEQGQRLEQANAVLNQGIWWEYQAANDGLVRVEAWDLASNVTRQEFSPSRFNSVWVKPRRRGVRSLTVGLVEKKKYRENRSSSHVSTHRMESMIITAAEPDGLQIQSIAARAGVFSQEEVDSVRVMWTEYLTLGPEGSGYHFLAYRDGDQVLGFAIYGPRDLTDGVFDLYWISVDPEARCHGVGRTLLTATEEAVRKLGGRILIAETSGTPPYEPARKFYFGMGYENEATIRDFYTPGDDLKIFTKRI